MALPPAVRAAAPTITEDEAIATLQEYFIVRGDPQGNLHLDAPITRAEAAAVFVRWEAHYAASGRTPVIDFRIFRTSS